MKFRIYLAILVPLLLQVGSLLAGLEKHAYFEHKTSQYLFRISYGPGEPYGVGSYAIRVYDTNGYDLVAGTIRSRDGELVKSWLADRSGKRSDIIIFIWMRSAGSGADGTLELLEFNGKTFCQIKLPSPDKSLLDGHMGHDRFDVVNRTIYWQFPLYRPGDPNSNPTGGTRCLELVLGKKKKWRIREPWQTKR